MDMNQTVGPLKWNAFEPQTEPPYGSSGKSPKETDAYVTREELQELKRSLCELMRLFLESYVTYAIEFETPHLDIHLN